MKVTGLSNNKIGIVFDLDGLLVDSEKLYWKANIQAAKEAGLDISEDNYLDLVGASTSMMEKFYDKYLPDKLARDNFIERTKKLVWQWVEEGQLSLRPGVQEALDKFKELNLSMGIASSSLRIEVDHDLWKTGIRNYFDFILTFDDVDKNHLKAKPAPDIYLEAQKKLKIPKDEILIFEDSSTGVTAAYNAGIECVMIPDIKKPFIQDKKHASLICKNFFDFLKKIH